jgi:hypothetical protein
MEEWLLMTWDKAHHIELVINGVMVNRLGGSGHDAKNSLPFILFTKASPKLFLPSLSVRLWKSLRSLKEMAESNGVTFHELQRFCDTRFAQSE